MGNNTTRRLTSDLNSLPSSPESESLSTSTQDGSDCSQQSLSSVRLEPLATTSNSMNKRKSAVGTRSFRLNQGEVSLPAIGQDFSSGKVLPFKEYKKWLTNFRNREQISKKRPMIRCRTATFRIRQSPMKKEELRSDGKVFVVDEERRRRTENRLDFTAINHAMTQPRNKVVPVTQLNVRQLKPCHWFDETATDASNCTMAVIRSTRSSALSYDLTIDNHDVNKKRPPTHLSPIMTRKFF